MSGGMFMSLSDRTIASFLSSPSCPSGLKKGVKRSWRGVDVVWEWRYVVSDFTAGVFWCKPRLITLKNE